MGCRENQNHDEFWRDIWNSYEEVRREPLKNHRSLGLCFHASSLDSRWLRLQSVNIVEPVSRIARPRFSVLVSHMVAAVPPYPHADKICSGFYSNGALWCGGWIRAGRWPVLCGRNLNNFLLLKIEACIDRAETMQLVKLRFVVGWTEVCSWLNGSLQLAEQEFAVGIGDAFTRVEGSSRISPTPSTQSWPGYGRGPVRAAIWTGPWPVLFFFFVLFAYQWGRKEPQ